MRGEVSSFESLPLARSNGGAGRGGGGAKALGCIAFDMQFLRCCSSR